MLLEFTQYLRPNGDRQIIRLEVTGEVEAKAEQILDAGLVFECEQLRTGEVSATITDPDAVNGRDLDVIVAPNDAALREAIETMILRFKLPN